ncbi:uncharacterized protein LOC6577167 [Drosophila mojavensis]|uniref:F-box domain-containing protein n=1 Tax=Drosophila mojavensis TaxID=7230 RepID=B4KJX5_DROMO|nr:uncharacterized protein LOC6577167 [Drosophila mojavensis]EDW12578.1 uncharacterized protein Dmoj_GI23995 [Drosophila mojavensis]
MSAYNRKVLKKQCPLRKSMDADSAMEESGYASFRVQHNSTMEAPFLFERHSESENWRNAPNTTTQSHFNSIQYQTPNSTSCDDSIFAPWHKSFCLPSVSCVQLEESEDEGAQACKSPLLQSSNQPQCAAKRRKSHYQPMAHHSSPKKSKKKLFPQPAVDSVCRTRYYDGCEHLDIVGMLSNTLPALECILSHVSSNTLENMTKVSERWAQAVHTSKRATERLHNHRFKMNLTKENAPQPLKHGRMLSKSMNNNLVPFQPSNAIQRPNKAHDGHKITPKDENCPLLVEQLQRIKCPRCGKSSRVFYSQPQVEQTPKLNRQLSTRAALSQTLPHAKSFNEPKNGGLTRFYSLDEVKSSPIPQSTGPSQAYSIGECTSVFCKFRFCVHCCCPPHPGAKCLVTEMGTPSKVMMPSERVTPPKRNQKFDYKLSRKNSLKRLNF